MLPAAGCPAAPLTWPHPRSGDGRLPNEEACGYKLVRTAILDALDIISETFWCWFHRKTYSLWVRSWVMAQELKDTCWRWLQPELRSTTKLAEQVVVEQFIHILPP